MRFALLITGRGTAAISDGVVVEVFRESGDGLTVLRAASRDQLAAGIVGVAVDGAGEIAKGSACFRDGGTTTGGVVGVVAGDAADPRAASEFAIGVIGRTFFTYFHLQCPTVFYPVVTTIDSLPLIHVVTIFANRKW